MRRDPAVSEDRDPLNFYQFTVKKKTATAAAPAAATIVATTATH